MFFLYSVIAMICMLLISYPYVKFYQMNGYSISKFFKNIFECPFKIDDKNRLIFTKRMVRFLILYAIVLFSIFIPLFIYVANFWLIFLDVVIIGLILPLFISFTHILIFPIELMIKKKYISLAKNKIINFNGIKIAIVGSFGKTSVKNILFQLLNENFKVVMTPKNYNTPMGICKTILNDLKNDCEIAIFEMGARREGEIKELMSIVSPNWGIMTAIGEQHIETFGDLETIKRTKFEMVKSMKIGNRIIFDGSSENTKDLYKKCDKTKYLANDANGFSWIENLSYSSTGASFDLHIDHKKSRVETSLLGNFNCENIVLASSIAYLLGVNFNYIVKKIKQLKPVKSRLELIDNGKFLIIDDSYNANVIGTKQSLEVLKFFKGEKVVITSGLVELGSLQYEKNFNLGKLIGNVANKVVIMNETNKKAILSGLKESCFDGNNIYFANTRLEQKEIIKRIATKGCVVLFQNDLPDNYR